MKAPAAVPALAILAGTAAACALQPAPGWPAALCAISLLAAGAAFARRRQTLFAVAITLAFAAAAWTLGIREFRHVAEPPLRAALSASLPTAAPVLVEGRLRSDASSGPNGILLDLELTGLDEAALTPAHQATTATTAPGSGRGNIGSNRTPGAALMEPAAGRRASVTLASALASAGPRGIRLTVAGSLAADRVGEWRAGRLVRLPATLRVPVRSLDPGVSDGRLDLARRGTVLVGSVKSGLLVEILSSGTWLEERAADLRAYARSAIGRHVGRWSPRAAAIVVAILIGDRVGLDDEVQQKLREAGTYHVIAISGGNIAILAGLIVLLLRVGRVPPQLGTALAIAALAAYASLVGGGASVVRATLMAAGYLAARQLDHRGPPLNALAAACALIVVAIPVAVRDAGFALTFGATLGILLGASVLGFDERGGARPAGRTGRWLRAPAALLVASLSAELALFPVSAFAFSRVTFAGLLLNFVAIPFMTVAQVAGMAVLALSGMWPAAASASGWIACAGAEGLVRSAALVDVAPWLSWRLPPPHAAALACYYGAWCAWFWARRVSSARSWRVAGMVMVAASSAWILTEPITLLWPGVSGRLRLVVLDVGHADAVLVQLPDRRSVLVDAGGSMTGSTFDVGGRVVAPALWALGTRRLDVLILTHGDPDHIGGAASVIRDFRPREVWEGIPVPAAAPLRHVRDLAGRVGAVWRERRAGEEVGFGAVTLRVWHPEAAEWERRKVRNDDSLVIELRYGEASLVLPGDIGSEVERRLAVSFTPAPVRVLKVPHHGSGTSSSPELIASLRPSVGIVSAAQTTKVPEAVLARYRAAGTEIFRTSEDGAITVTTDGHWATVETFTGRRLTIGATKNRSSLLPP